MLRSGVLAAVFGCASAARVGRKANLVRTNRIGSVPVYGAASADETFLVYFDPKTPDAVLDEFCAAGSCVYKGHPEAGGLAFVVMNNEKAMTHAVFAHQGMVQSVEYNGQMEDDEISTDGSAGSTWGLERVGIARSRGSGEGVNIYVLDSGVRVTHQDFGDRAIPTLNALNLPPTVCDAADAQCVYDNRGHGSHCAGSAAGTKYGVAPKATIRAMNRGRSYADAFASIDWVAVNAIKPAVLTMSFGSGGQAAGSEAAVDAVVNQGVTVTVSAGNNNYDACQKTFAFIPSAIVVGSTDSRDRRSGFSNFGSCIDIWAPGSSIPSADYRTDTGERVLSGTSMATPHVAGGIAVILGNEPDLNPSKVLQRLLDTSEENAITDVKEGSPNLLLNIGA